MAQQVLMPRLSPDMTAGQIVEWLRRVGDVVTEGQVLAMIESDKAEVELPSPGSGILGLILVEVGEEVSVGTPIAILTEPGEIVERPRAAATPTAAPATPAPAAAVQAAAATVSVAGGAPAGRRPVSPSARRAAQELGVDVALVAGTGPDGLVTDGDVRAFAAARPAAGATTAPAAAPGKAAPGGAEVAESIPLTGRRRRMAERVLASSQSTAPVTTMVDVDMSAVDELRKRDGASFTAYVAWAACQSLHEFPILNASLAGDAITVWKDVHLGVAVAAEEGLVVVVVRDADRKDPAAMSSAIDDLAGQVRAGKAGPDVLTGGTFTVTNSGAFGSLMFTPIINVPEVAILGMGKVADAAVVRDGQIVVRKVMYLCLTYDHRVIDGAPAVRFLQAVKKRLEGIAAAPAGTGR
jgi:pyruvate/2-oxoglutarate dehydrogenase complex dihydrolipoamide acyltransferase (E2) component